MKERMDADDPEISRFTRAFAGADPEPGHFEGNASAVLVPVFVTADGAALLFTRRAETLNTHAGQVSFPGGRVDVEDESARAAALRETWEEVGVAPQRVRMFGHVTDMVTHYGAFIRAYAGFVDGEPPRVPASPDEVSEILVVPVRDLLDPGRYEARAIAGDHGVVHYFRTANAVVWGITGDLTARFLTRAYAWERPHDARVVDELRDFLP